MLVSSDTIDLTIAQVLDVQNWYIDETRTRELTYGGQLAYIVTVKHKRHNVAVEGRGDSLGGAIVSAASQIAALKGND